MDQTDDKKDESFLSNPARKPNITLPISQYLKIKAPSDKNEAENNQKYKF